MEIEESRGACQKNRMGDHLISASIRATRSCTHRSTSSSIFFLQMSLMTSGSRAPKNIAQQRMVSCFKAQHSGSHSTDFRGVRCSEFLGKLLLGSPMNHLLLSRRFCLAVILGSCGRARKRAGTYGRLRKKGFATWVAFTEDIGGVRCAPGEDGAVDVGGEDVACDDGDDDFSIGDAREVNAGCSPSSRPMRSNLCFEITSLSSSSLPPPLMKNKAPESGKHEKKEVCRYDGTRRVHASKSGHGDKDCALFLLLGDACLFRWPFQARGECWKDGGQSVGREPGGTRATLRPPFSSLDLPS